MAIDRFELDVADLAEAFESLEDPRSEVNRLHPLPGVLTIAVMGGLAGVGGPTGIAEWANRLSKRRQYPRFLSPSEVRFLPRNRVKPRKARKNHIMQGMSSSERKNASVTIILPTYNRESVLPQAFEAIHDQTFTDWELIIIDDGSTDNTREVVDSATAEWAQPVRYIWQENRGAYAARNTGLDHATGEYIAFYDSDDLWLPHHLHDCVGALETNAGVDWVYGACRMVDYTSGREMAGSTFYVEGVRRPFMELETHKTGELYVIVDKRVVECMALHGLYSGLQNSLDRSRVFSETRFDHRWRNAEDQLVVIRALMAGIRFGYFDNVHVTYHVHKANSSGAAQGAALRSRLRIQEQLIQGRRIKNLDVNHGRRCMFRESGR